MTQEEIRQGNIEIAEMLGYINTTPIDKDFNIYEKKNGEVGELIEAMSVKFHSDWNWLMEAVEFIQKILIKKDYEFCIEFYEGLSNEPVTFVSFGEKEYRHKKPINAVFKAVSEFAKCYNNKEI